jgi:hypothetical protein
MLHPRLKYRYLIYCALFFFFVSWVLAFYKIYRDDLFFKEKGDFGVLYGYSIGVDDEPRMIYFQFHFSFTIRLEMP